MNDFKLKYIYLENNGLDDESFPELINEIKKRNDLHSFICLNNELGEKTILKIIEMAEELSYSKFSVIKFGNCKIRFPLNKLITLLE